MPPKGGRLTRRTGRRLPGLDRPGGRLAGRPASDDDRRRLVVAPPPARPAVPDPTRTTCGPQPDRRLRARHVRTGDLRPVPRGRPPHAHPPALLRPDRPAADAGGGRRLRRRPRPRRLRAAVDRLLACPHYGERWARHWLDVVHYGDTHGYDKDQPRPNAWPYRDYVIRAFNEDKPYARFVAEQVAGDVLFPGTPTASSPSGSSPPGRGTSIGHAELPRGQDRQGKVARTSTATTWSPTTLNTFASLTVQCARCHNHKFDPITQEDYYRLQAVFAGVDRADRPTTPTRRRPARRRADRDARRAAPRGKALLRRRRRATPPARSWPSSTAKLDALRRSRAASAARVRLPQRDRADAGRRPSGCRSTSGRPTPIDEIACSRRRPTRFNGIGAGFGFPVRFKVEARRRPDFRQRGTARRPHRGRTSPNPGDRAGRHPPPAGNRRRYVRVTATKLAPRQDDYIFALAELRVVRRRRQERRRRRRPVTALDSIEAAARWGESEPGRRLRPPAQRPPPTLARPRAAAQRGAPLGRAAADRRSAPRPKCALAASQARGEAAADGAGATPARSTPARAASAAPAADAGKPRPIHVLRRGDVKQPGRASWPRARSAASRGLPARFRPPDPSDEGDRRAALADWITDPRNPLTWRSIVNRVWQYHFGRGHRRHAQRLRPDGRAADAPRAARLARGRVPRRRRLAQAAAPADRHQRHLPAVVARQRRRRRRSTATTATSGG